MKTFFSISLLTLILSAVVALAVSCSLSARDDNAMKCNVKVERYDSLQYLFLVGGDYSALQQMKTKYPTETRTLLENILRIGSADSGDVSERMLKYFQDPALQTLIQNVEEEFSDFSGIDTELTKCFKRLEKVMPHLSVPQIYTQIDALNESIVVGNENTIGISLDKYMGKDYPLYKKYYTKDQLQSMSREYIVPDCLCYYLISLYQQHDLKIASQQQRDEHVACVQWVVNYAMNKRFYSSELVMKVDKYMRANPKTTFDELLSLGMK